MGPAMQGTVILDDAVEEVEDLEVPDWMKRSPSVGSARVLAPRGPRPVGRVLPPAAPRPPVPAQRQPLLRPPVRQPIRPPKAPESPQAKTPCPRSVLTPKRRSAPPPMRALTPTTSLALLQAQAKRPPAMAKRPALLKVPPPPSKEARSAALSQQILELIESAREEQQAAASFEEEEPPGEEEFPFMDGYEQPDEFAWAGMAGAAAQGSAALGATSFAGAWPAQGGMGLHEAVPAGLAFQAPGLQPPPSACSTLCLLPQAGLFNEPVEIPIAGAPPPTTLALAGPVSFAATFNGDPLEMLAEPEAVPEWTANPVEPPGPTLAVPGAKRRRT